MTNFIDWFKEFIKYVRHTLKLVGPIILFLDGYYSHLVIIVIDLAIENNIHLILIEPNSSQAWQPLDVACYHRTKKAWSSIAREFYLSGNTMISKFHWPKLLVQLLKKCLFPEHIISGFRKTGIYPLSLDKMMERTAPSTAFSYS